MSVLLGLYPANQQTCWEYPNNQLAHVCGCLGYELAKARAHASRNRVEREDEGLPTGRRALLTCEVRGGVRKVREVFFANQIGFDAGMFVERLHGSR